VTTGQGLLGNNMFTYCNNNPINSADCTGTLPVIFNEDYAGSNCTATAIPVPIPIPLPYPVLNGIEDDTKAWVEAQTGLKEYRDNCVYVLKDPTDNNLVKYVGRTNDPGRREKEHKNDPLHPQRADYNMVVLVTGLTKNEAMAVEQFLISAYTVGYLENARREISARRVPQFESYLGAIAEIHTGISGNTILEFMTRR
jgi:predicted GIY-YIG superfamily endonuclease